MVPIPALTLCIRYFDILNYSSLSAADPLMANNYQLNQTNSRNIQQSITIGQIFRHTPPSNDMFYGCLFRHPDNYTLIKTDNDGCQRMFNIEKFYIQESVCYWIDPIDHNFKHGLEYDYETVSSELYYITMAFEVSLKFEHFNRSTVLQPVVHRPTTTPSFSVHFSPQVQRLFTKSSTVQEPLNYIHLSNSYITLKRMPDPYTTKCADYQALGLLSKDHCFSMCIQKLSFRELKKFPYTVIAMENVKFWDYQARNESDNERKHVSIDDTNDPIINSKLRKMNRECDKQCRWPACSASYAILQLISTGYNRDAIYFRVDLPRNPSFSISFSPAMYFYEYILQIMACSGTWLGLSVLHFSPIKLMYWFKLKRRLTRNRINHGRQRLSKSSEFVKTNVEIWTLLKKQMDIHSNLIKHILNELKKDQY